MPRITVTGATGQFGGQVIAFLLKRGVQPGELRASVRDVSKAAHLQAQGLDVRRGDFDDPEAVRNAFEATEHLLIISTDQVGRRVEQHRRAVQAAREAGVKHIAYTSVVDMGPGDSNSPIAVDHRATEALIRESGIPFTFLRNTFYAEYMLAPVLQALDQGVFVANTGEARLGAAALADLAEAAAVVLSEPGHANKVYELTYPRTWDYREAVEVVSRVSGRPLEYRPVSDEEMAQVLRQAGTPEDAAQMALGMNRTLREGNLSKATGDLEQVLGRPVTSLEELVRRMLRG
jgi:NAD(P)H dehydrogenase (quinone)